MIDLNRPLKLNPDCFTPLSRTPWAGQQIYRRYKKNLLGGTQELAIGESWEVSCDPDFPSRVLDLDIELAGLIQREADLLLSPSYVQRKGANCEILIKLLNAASPLSVQVHPSDDDSHLKPHECGKPESWLILDAEPGAGLYLGFSQAISRETLRKLLKDDADLKPYLQFVPVQAGDYFEIQPGVPHAIGPGITLLEPQRVLLGRSGKTYRFWDWGRRYAKDGSLDPHGQARELHVEEGLRLIDPERQVGETYVSTLRRKAETLTLPGGGRMLRYPANTWYQVYHLSLKAQTRCVCTMREGFATLVSLGGDTAWTSAAHRPVRFTKGEPGFLPYAAFPLTLEAATDSELALVVPTGAALEWSELK